MEIKGRVHCFFEQSGTFKNEFKKLGIDAEDYDIQNNFGETDNVIDLFAEIENAYNGKESRAFERITKNDLIFAFFPCTEFCGISQAWFNLNHRDFQKWDDEKRKFDYMIEKNRNRAKMFELLYKLCGIAMIKGIRLIFENPYSMNTYLKQNVFLKEPSIIDNDRTRRGDYFVKPTAYWFFNCEPTHGMTYQQPQMIL